MEKTSLQDTDEKTKSRQNFCRRLKSVVIISLCVFTVISSLMITVGFPKGVPSWNKIFSVFGISADLDNELSLSFVSVGCADACYIKCGDKSILIDAGTDISSHKLKTYLKHCGCMHLDAMIISHPDSDHIGGAAEIINEFGVDTVYMSRISDELISNNSVYIEFINSVKENNIKLIFPEVFSTADIGELRLEFISPNREYGKTNDDSLVVRLVYRDISALFTGDISSKVEEVLLNSEIELKSDILKVAHHGSKSSSSENFLAAVKPRVSVISVGENDYSLPDYNTLAYINHYSESMYRTDSDGTVVITYDGNNFKIKTNC